MNTVVSPECRLCGSSESQLVSRCVSEAPGSSVYRCANCGIVAVFPIMTEEEEGAFYEQQFEEYTARRSGTGWRSAEPHCACFREEAERRGPLGSPHVRAHDNVL